MRNLRPLLSALLVGLGTTASGSTPADDAMTADAAFAARAAEVGHHAAFVEFLAEDAVLFRPGAVPGQSWLASHEPAAGRLQWSPSAAVAACTGRLALTTGPWQYWNAQGGEPVEGHYLSVWRLDGDGRWRVVLDHGIDHAPEAQPVPGLQELLDRAWPTGRGPEACGEVADRVSPDRADAELDAEIERRGLEMALLSAAGAALIVYRDDAAPGPVNVVLPARDAAFGQGSVARLEGSFVDPGGDLAVTYGTLQSADGTERAAYVRAWSRERRRWRLVVDLETPLPAP